MFKDNFTSLEQSKWLKEFFEKYTEKKPENYFKWGQYLEEESVVPPSPELFIRIEDHDEWISIEDNTYFNDMDYDVGYPAYLLAQLEGILPNDFEIGDQKYEIRWEPSKSYYYQTIWGKLEYIRLRHISRDRFENVIELLILLDEKGCLGKGEV